MHGRARKKSLCFVNQFSPAAPIFSCSRSDSSLSARDSDYASTRGERTLRHTNNSCSLLAVFWPLTLYLLRALRLYAIPSYKWLSPSRMSTMHLFSTSRGPQLSDIRPAASFIVPPKRKKNYVVLSCSNGTSNGQISQGVFAVLSDNVLSAVN